MASFFKTIASAVSSSVELPEHKVVEKEQPSKEDDFEVREYPETKWASTKIKAMKHSDASSTGFWRLFNYIQGKNEKEQKIEMTAPVAIRVEPGAGPNCESTFTVSFFIGKEHHENPAKPSNPEVFLETWPPMTVLSRRFGGFSSEEKWVDHAKSLAEATEKQYGDKYHKEFYFTAGYDSPFKLFNRRNEVWFIMKDA